MIQRIQTVWLLLASLSIFALFLFPYLHYSDAAVLGKSLMVSGRYQHQIGEDIREQFFFLQTAATVILGLLPLYTIFKFKNRKLQIQLIVLEMVLIALFGFWLYTSASKALADVQRFLSAGNIGVGFFLLPIAIVFLFLAMSGIRKDESLIRSAERLR